MRSYETGSLAFVIRIWNEPSELVDTSPEWRGMIQHVESGERRYFRGIDEMMNFVLPYLENTSMRKPHWRDFMNGRGIKLWLKQRIGKMLR